MDAQEIRELTAEEIEHALNDSRKELFNLRLQNQTGQLENPAQIRVVRRSIARLLTEQNARQKL